METMHKPEAPSRELTKTEIDIAVAQIIDRLTRFLTFQNLAWFSYEELARDFFFPDSTSDEELQQLKLEVEHGVAMKKLSDEFQVPIETILPLGGAIPDHHQKKTASKARKWVNGEMSPQDLSTFWEEAVDFYNYNIGWVLMETPSFGQQVDEDQSDESTFLKFMEIGCRNFRGPKLIDVSGPRNSLIAEYELEWNRRRSE